MRYEPRPRLRKSIGIFGLCFLLALTAYSTVLWKTPNSRITGSISTVQGRSDVDLRVQSPPAVYTVGLALLNSVSAVLFYEFVVLIVRYFWWGQSMAKDIVSFFGTSADTRSKNAAVILQMDKVEDIANPSNQASERVFKARNWINASDSDAARHILRELLRIGLDAPLPRYMGRHETFPTDPEAPFQIFFGLGYTNYTKELIDGRCGDWLRIRYNSKYGDVIWLRHNLVVENPDYQESDIVPADYGGEEGVNKPTAEEVRQFRLILPKGWTSDTYTKWLAGESVRDYAIILRYTNTEISPGMRVIQFVVAGFTENGTHAAGAFLAKHWQQRLHSKYVYGKSERGADGFGDFCTFIAGLSAQPETWSEVAEGAITTQRLENIGLKQCHWVERCQITAKKPAGKSAGRGQAAAHHPSSSESAPPAQEASSGKK
jgi:hypothetical protein